MRTCSPKLLPFPCRLGFWMAFTIAIGSMYPTQGGPPSSAGFSPERYQSLWSKTLFIPPTMNPRDFSPDFTLCGAGKIGQEFFVTIEDKTSHQSFVIMSGKPARGFSLIAIHDGDDPKKTYAVVEREGQTLNLKLAEESSASTRNVPKN